MASSRFAFAVDGLLGVAMSFLSLASRSSRRGVAVIEHARGPGAAVCSAIPWLYVSICSTLAMSMAKLLWLWLNCREMACPACPVAS